jgi:hypothetical protein
VYQDSDGMVVIKGRLTPELGAIVMKALEAARETLYRHDHDRVVHTLPADPPTYGQQQADALGLLAETALHHGMDPGTPAEHYQVVVHVDASVLADADAPGQSVLEDGVRVSAETSQRLACDASRVIMEHDADGHIVGVSARTRTIPPALRRALAHRDPGCRFPGCGLRQIQAHHIVHWAHGGPTTLANTTSLCRRHHRAVHEEGYTVTRLPDGELEFRHPYGRVLENVPPPPDLAFDSVRVIRASNEAEGVSVHPRIGIPDWHGEHLDVGWAIAVLHPIAIGET